MAHDNVVENFDFQKLTRSDEIAGDLDNRLSGFLDSAEATNGM